MKTALVTIMFEVQFYILTIYKKEVIVKKVILSAITFMLGFSLFGEQVKLEDYVNSAYIEELKKNGKIELILKKLKRVKRKFLLLLNFYI